MPGQGRASGCLEAVRGDHRRPDAYGAGVARGRLITIEGLDGAGKSTLAAGPGRGELAARGCAVELLREPGGVRGLRAHPRAGQGPAPRGRAARRGAAVRRRPRPARAGAPGAAAARRRDRAAGPLRRLLAGLPGRRPRAGRRPGGRDQPLRHRSARARPHAAVAHLARRRPRAPARARCAGPTGSSARARTSSPRSPPPTSSSRAPSPSGSARSTPAAARGRCSRTRSRPSRTCCRAACPAGTSMSGADVRRIHRHGTSLSSGAIARRDADRRAADTRLRRLGHSPPARGSSPTGRSPCATPSPRPASARPPPGPNSATGCGSDTRRCSAGPGGAASTGVYSPRSGRSAF